MNNRNRLLEKFLQDSKWSYDDGLLPGLWDRYPEGHRCLWSCRWVVDGAIVIPDDLPSDYEIPPLVIQAGKVIARPASAPRTALDFELLDVVARGEDTGQPLVALRLAYPVYIWPWSMAPSRMVGAVALRPGWPKPAWAR